MHICTNHLISIFATMSICNPWMQCFAHDETLQVQASASQCKQASAAAFNNCFRRFSTSCAFRWRSWSASGTWVFHMSAFSSKLQAFYGLQEGKHIWKMNKTDGEMWLSVAFDQRLWMIWWIWRLCRIVCCQLKFFLQLHNSSRSCR